MNKFRRSVAATVFTLMAISPGLVSAQQCKGQPSFDSWVKSFKKDAQSAKSASATV